MQGIMFAVMAGVFISLQTVFNTRVSEKVGMWATTTLVLGLGLITSFPIFLIMDDTQLYAIGNVNKIYLLGGFLGVGVVYCIMQAIKLLGPAYAISIVLVAQIFIAVLIDTFGWFGFDTISLTINKLVGLALLVAGIVVFKLKKEKKIDRQQKQLKKVFSK